MEEIAQPPNTNTREAFVTYVADFYGDIVLGIGDHIFGGLPPARDEIGRAADLLIRNYRVAFKRGDFAGDSMDREIVRDIILAWRGQPPDPDATEYSEIVCRLLVAGALENAGRLAARLRELSRLLEFPIDGSGPGWITDHGTTLGTIDCVVQELESFRSQISVPHRGAPS